MAAATSLGGGSVDQRLPTRWTSPRRSKSCSRASALSLLRPAARAAIAVENEAGSLRSATRRRSGRSVPRPPGRCAAGASGSAVAGTGSNAGAGRGPPADRPRTGLGSRRTRRRAPARLGGRPQTDATHDQSGTRRSGVRRFLSRSRLRYATAFSPHHRACRGRGSASCRGQRRHTYRLDATPSAIRRAGKTGSASDRASGGVARNACLCGGGGREVAGGS